jgi:hypothetical protein
MVPEVLFFRGKSITAKHRLTAAWLKENAGFSATVSDIAFSSVPQLTLLFLPLGDLPFCPARTLRRGNFPPGGG